LSLGAVPEKPITWLGTILNMDEATADFLMNDLLFMIKCFCF